MVTGAKGKKEASLSKSCAHFESKELSTGRYAIFVFPFSVWQYIKMDYNCSKNTRIWHPLVNMTVLLTYYESFNIFIVNKMETIVGTVTDLAGGEVLVLS